MDYRQPASPPSLYWQRLAADGYFNSNGCGRKTGGLPWSSAGYTEGEALRQAQGERG